MKKLLIVSLFAFSSSLFNFCKAQYKDLLNFNETNGAAPYGSLTVIGNRLCGMTPYGGVNGFGLIFSLDTNGNGYTDLFDFNGTNGSYPFGNLTVLNNKFYGMTNKGGLHGDGCVFSIDTATGKGYKDLFDFNGTEGATPMGSLTVSGNKLYGMTESGGAYGYGCVFSLDTNSGSTYKDMLDFNGTNGANPYGSLTYSSGVLYGMTSVGGAHDSGIIFSIDTSGNNYKDLVNLSSTNGAFPYGDLTLSENTLYGMTSRGGTSKYYGCIFSLDTNGNGYKVKFNFNSTNSYFPYGDLTLSGNTLYGLTNRGGAHYFGTIFSVDTNGSNYNDLFDMTYATGCQPTGSLTLLGNTLYGTTDSGGNGGKTLTGVIFSFKDKNITTSTNAIKPSIEAINAYPNPNNGIFTLNYTMSESDNVQISIINELGQVVYQEQKQVNNGSNTEHLNLENLALGIYSLRMQTNTSITVRKLVKVN